MFLCLVSILALLSTNQQAKTAAPPARATMTAPLACLHCTFGEGDSCALCLKLDEKTPVLLTGKAAKPFESERLGGQLVIASGSLALNKDKRFELFSEEVLPATPKALESAPAKGYVRVTGHACCAKCDLGKFEQCTMAVKNAAAPLVLAGKLADQHAGESAEPRPVVVTGRLSVDKAGVIRLEAVKVEDVKKK